MRFIGKNIAEHKFPKLGATGSIPVGGIPSRCKTAEICGFYAYFLFKNTKKSLKTILKSAVCSTFVGLFTFTNRDCVKIKVVALYCVAAFFIYKI